MAKLDITKFELKNHKLYVEIKIEFETEDLYFPLFIPQFSLEVFSLENREKSQIFFSEDMKIEELQPIDPNKWSAEKKLIFNIPINEKTFNINENGMEEINLNFDLEPLTPRSYSISAVCVGEIEMTKEEINEEISLLKEQIKELEELKTVK